MSANTYRIANPPVGIYRGDLPVTYANINVLLDIHARKTKSKGFKVSCPIHSFNALGKRAENLGLDGSIESLRKYYSHWRQQCSLRERLGLSFSGELSDCAEQSMMHAQQIILALHKKGYVERSGNDTYLNVDKIHSAFPCKKFFDAIEFYPSRAKTEFSRLLEENRKPVKISKERTYSVDNPLGGSKISPIFVVANMWDAYFNGPVDLIACSEKELSRYILLRFYSRIPISDSPPMKEVFISNLVQPEGGIDSWNLAGLMKDNVDADALRYAFAKSFSRNKQSMSLGLSAFHGGTKLVHLVGNINKFFKNYQSQLRKIPPRANLPLNNISPFNFNTEITLIEEKFRSVSKDIRHMRDGSSDKSIDDVFNTYMSTINDFEPFCPFICEKVSKDQRRVIA